MRSPSAKTLFLLSSGIILLTVLGREAAGLARPAATGARVAQAARDLLDSLSEEQRKKVLFGFEDAERFNWHFIPRERKGLVLKELDASGRSKVLALLQAGMSPQGAELAEAVMAHEEILAGIEGPSRRLPRDPLLYHVSIFGKPADERWGWRLEGHHLSVNFTLEGERIRAVTPIFFGANPAIVREGPRKGLRLLGGVEDRARELVSTLKEDALKACRGEEGSVPEEVPGAETPRYKGPLPKGIPGDRLEPEQRKVLASLLAEYTRNLPSDLAPSIDEGSWKDVHLAWRGSLKAYEPHSYLIHGPGFVINYSNVQNGAAHVHASYRRPGGDFGLPAEAK